jgi:hypothetical protein
VATVTPSAYEVHPYSKEILIRLTAELSGQNSVDQIRKKSHPGYLDGYFQHMDVSTVLVERFYVDRDYLEDFAAYYVRCFEPYRRHCSRLHFFCSVFDERDFGGSCRHRRQTLRCRNSGSPTVASLLSNRYRRPSSGVRV